MPVLKISLSLPELLHRELIEACVDCGCHPTEFASQAVEAVLASRRLPRVPDGKFGARIGARETREPEEREARSALMPSDVPTLEDLSCLEEL